MEQRSIFPLVDKRKQKILPTV